MVKQAPWQPISPPGTVPTDLCHCVIMTMTMMMMMMMIYKTKSLGGPYILLKALRASLLCLSRPAGVHVTHTDGLDTQQAIALDW